MATKSLLIKNGIIVSEGRRIVGDLLAENGKIKKIGKNLSSKSAEVLDAGGCLVLPGGVDPHTHMELPMKGFSASDDFESGTAAALYGGTTTIIDFANQKKGGTIKAALDLWHEKADGSALCDYAFHVSVTDYNERTAREMKRCVSEWGVNSFKTFTAYKGVLGIDDAQLLGVMELTAELGGIVLIHAENGDLIERAVAENRTNGRLAPRYHEESRPWTTEAEAVSRAVDLARHAECPLYVVHLSSGESLARLDFLRARHSGGSPVFVETCPQYLLLDRSLYRRPGFEGAKYVMSPPLRDKRDCSLLWSGLSFGSIDTVATDHCPFWLKDKARGRRDFSKIPNGAPGVENRMELLFSEGVVKGHFSLERFVELTAERPARIFGLYPKKGVLRPGADADIVIFDPTVRHTLSARTHHMRCDYSAYEGMSVTGKCLATVIRGEVAVYGGELLIHKGFGRYLRR
jgi:dihydropyrimidinase